MGLLALVPAWALLAMHGELFGNCKPSRLSTANSGWTEEKGVFEVSFCFRSGTEAARTARQVGKDDVSYGELPHAAGTCFPLPSRTRSAMRSWSEALTRGGGATAAADDTPRVPARKPGLTGKGPRERH